MSAPTRTPGRRIGVGWSSPVVHEWWFVRTPWGRAARAAERVAVMALLDEAARGHDSVLEVGPGTGAYTIAAAPLVRRLVAVEPEREMRRYLASRLRDEGHANVSVRDGRLPHPLAAETAFDGALAVGVLDFVPDLDGALGALARATRPGGWVIVTTPAATPAGRLATLTGRLKGRRVWARRRSELRAAAMRAGLRVRRLSSVGVLPGGRTLVALAIAEAPAP